MNQQNKQNTDTIDERFKKGAGSYGGSKDTDKDPANESDKLNKMSQKSSGDGDWKTNVGAGAEKLTPADKFGKAILNFKGKKKAWLLGTGGAIGLTIFMTIMAPSSLFTAFNRNMSITNDTTSTTMQRMLTKTLGRLSTNSAGDGIACAGANKARCVGGKLSNKGLRSLHKKGIEIHFTDNTQYSPKNRRGMPNSAIKHYVIDGQPVTPKELKGHLQKNPKAASKVVGIKGAWNLRFRSFAGKYIGTKFFGKLNLSKGASLAKALSKPFKNAATRLKAVNKAIAARIPGLQKVGDVMGKFSGFLSQKLGAAKANTAYLAGVVACMTIKIPSAMATAAAGLELARLLPLVQEYMSAGDFITASGMYTDADGEEFYVSPEAASAIGAKLTEKDENGKSALDSPMLLSALGINTNATGVSERFAPGYDVITNPIVKAGQVAERAAQGLCGFILSPAAMWTSTGVGIAMNATGVGLLFSAAGFALSFAAQPLMELAAEKGMEKALGAMLETDKLEDIKGEELGDALGTAGKAYFSAHATSSNMPVLSQNNVDEAKALHQATLEDERKMDIASHSPFDISNHNTFLGSAVNKAQLAMIVNGGLSSSLMSRLRAFAMLPMSFASLSQSSVGASSSAVMDCGYAKAFNLEVTDANGNVDKDLTPAVNAAGMPCTGFTKEQENMDIDEATEALVERGWIKGLGSSTEEVDVSEEAGTEDFLRAVIVKNSLVETIYDSCSNLSDGTHLTEASGCISRKSLELTKDGVTDDSGIAKGLVYDEKEDEEGEMVSRLAGEVDVDSEDEIVLADGPKKYSDAKAFNAIPVFLMSVMMERMINGADDAEYGGGGTSGAVVGDVVQTAVAFSWPDADHAVAEPTPGYAKAISDLGITGWQGPAGKDCGRFVGAVLHSSGADTDFPLDGTTSSYSSYMDKSDKYERINATSYSDLKPGDILNSASIGHIKIYIGPDAASDGGGVWAEASYKTHYGHRGWPGSDSDAMLYDVFRLK